MQTLKYLDKDDLEENLLHSAGLIGDEVDGLSNEILQIFKEHGTFSGMENDEEMDEWFEKTGYFDVQAKWEKKILKRVFDCLV